jgi:hypothetical protein
VQRGGRLRIGGGAEPTGPGRRRLRSGQPAAERDPGPDTLPGGYRTELGKLYGYRKISSTCLSRGAD